MSSPLKIIIRPTIAILQNEYNKFYLLAITLLAERSCWFVMLQCVDFTYMGKTLIRVGTRKLVTMCVIHVKSVKAGRRIFNLSVRNFSQVPQYLRVC